MKFTVTKTYRDFPAAHRQPNHDGHCRLIHGHNWGWDITFSCVCLDVNGFVLDVGKLGQVRNFLTDHFDHTLLLNEDDPELVRITSEVEKKGLAKIKLVPNCGMEGLARFVFDRITSLLMTKFEKDVVSRGLTVISVTCWEDSKNSATYLLE